MFLYNVKILIDYIKWNGLMEGRQAINLASGEERMHLNTSRMMGNHMYDGHYAVEFYTELSYRLHMKSNVFPFTVLKKLLACILEHHKSKQEFLFLLGNIQSETQI